MANLMVPWEFNLTSGNLILRYDYDVNGNTTYIGWAQPGALTSDPVWRILLQSYDGFQRIISTGFPTASCGFSFIWDNRTSYVYS